MLVERMTARYRINSSSEKGRTSRRHFAGFDFGKVENVVENLQQRLGGPRCALLT